MRGIIQAKKYPLGYWTGEIKALQLIVFVLFGAVDKILASWMLVHFFKISMKMIMAL